MRARRDKGCGLGDTVEGYARHLLRLQGSILDLTYHLRLPDLILLFINLFSFHFLVHEMNL